MQGRNWFVCQCFCGTLQSSWASIVLQAGIMAAEPSPGYTELHCSSLHVPWRVLPCPAVLMNFFSVLIFSTSPYHWKTPSKEIKSFFFFDSTRPGIIFFSNKTFYSEKTTCFIILILFVLSFYMLFLHSVLWLWTFMWYWLEVLVTHRVYFSSDS